MTEQIWYTWSKQGMGQAFGYRVRAASNKLRDVQGMAYKSIDRYLRYELPPGVNPNRLLPEQAPVSFALIEAVHGQLVLVHKVYVGKDGMGRAGNYFAHLLTDLPRGFSARDAIRLWQSPFWQRCDDPQLPVLLPTIDELPQYSQQRLDFASVQKKLQQLIITFLLTKGRLPHIDITASSELVATLIWGITHSIPQTLIPGLTFTTYEPDTKTRSETIVGTITANGLDMPGKNIELFIDPQPQSSALNDRVSAYASKVIEWLLATSNGESEWLNEFIAEVERDKIDTVEHLLNAFDSFCKQKEAIALLAPLVDEESPKVDEDKPEQSGSFQEAGYAAVSSRQVSTFSGEQPLPIQPLPIQPLPIQPLPIMARLRRIGSVKIAIALLAVCFVGSLVASCAESIALVQAYGMIRMQATQVALVSSRKIIPSGSNSQQDVASGSPGSSLVGSSDISTVTRNQKHTLYISLRNSGSSTWSDQGNYALVCTANSHHTGPTLPVGKQATCLGRDSIGLDNFKILPGQTYTFAISFIPSQAPGDYLTYWQLQHKSKNIGQEVAIEVIVT